MTTIQKEQGGVSAQKAIEFLSPMIKDVLDNEAAGTDTGPSFAERFTKKFESMPQDELLLLGHRLDALGHITAVLLSAVATVALGNTIPKTDPRLS